MLWIGFILYNISVLLHLYCNVSKRPIIYKTEINTHYR